MPHRLEFAAWVPFPLAQVFAFFSNPENLPRLMPPATETRIECLQLVEPARPPGPNTTSVQPAAGVGSIITTSFRPFPFLPWRREWIAAITEFEWNHHFADVQQKGPFKQWHHRHEFTPEARERLNGTLVRDLIEYEVGFGWPGALANSLFIARQMRPTFAARQKILPQLLA
jgi:ligand-binding SRPBCC domain-containing protein